MGVVFVSITATDEIIQQLHREPPLVWRLYSPEDDEFYLSAIGADKKPGFISRLFGAKQVPIPDPLPNIVMAEDDRAEIDLDKSWDGINFYLKNLVPEDVPNLFEGGKSIGKIEIGYGPAMSFFSDEVRKISASYNLITPQALLDEFNPQKMKAVYPKAMWKEGREDTRDYLEENFTALCAFLHKAAKRNLGIVVIYT